MRDTGGDQRLLVLGGDEPEGDRRLGARLDRAKLLNEIARAGGKVRHDSGGRLLVVEIPAGAEKALAERIPGARLVALDAGVEVPGLDPTESLFLDALRIRTSPAYREAKSNRTYGDTPEEQELLTAPDVREEY